jgi:ketosteroid isomerase-like protein
VIVARRMTADRRGRHLNTRGAIHCTIRDGLVSDVEMYEEDLDAVEEFWA